MGGKSIQSIVIFSVYADVGDAFVIWWLRCHLQGGRKDVGLVRHRPGLQYHPVPRFRHQRPWMVKVPLNHRKAVFFLLLNSVQVITFFSFSRQKKNTFFSSLFSTEKNQSKFRWKVGKNFAARLTIQFNVILEQYFKRHPSTNFNKTPSVNYILL